MLSKPSEGTDKLKEKYKDLLMKYSPVVLGEGSKEAAIFIIGEAPGGREIEENRPFAGAAGKNFDEFLELLGLQRKNVYITNAVKFRPVKENPAVKRLSNRTPTMKEIRLFRPLLLDEIQEIKPSVIVTLGNTPLLSLTGKSIKIGDVHGTAAEFEGKTLYPLYHPASLLYNRKLKETYIQDLMQLKMLLKNKSLV